MQKGSFYCCEMGICQFILVGIHFPETRLWLKGSQAGENFLFCHNVETFYHKLVYFVVVKLVRFYKSNTPAFFVIYDKKFHSICTPRRIDFFQRASAGDFPIPGSCSWPVCLCTTVHGEMPLFSWRVRQWSAVLVPEKKKHCWTFFKRDVWFLFFYKFR